MTGNILDISARCVENDACIYRGKDMFVDIGITNHQDTEIGFPLSFLRDTGPIIRLIDVRTGAETYVPNSAADPALREDFTVLHPEQTVFLQWMIARSELEQLGGLPVDLHAEITVIARIQVEGKVVDFRGVDTLRIASEGKTGS